MFSPEEQRSTAELRELLLTFMHNIMYKVRMSALPSYRHAIMPSLWAVFSRGFSALLSRCCLVVAPEQQQSTPPKAVLAALCPFA